MSSGWGLQGRTGRCFPFYKDFVECMSTAEDPIKQCTVLRDDYLECLHHRKECERKLAIKKEAERQSNGSHGSGGHGHH